MKIFVSVPMSGREDSEIRAEINNIEEMFRKRFPEWDDVEFVDNLGCDFDPKRCVDLVTPPLGYLSEAIKRMAYCDGVVFSETYFEARGCAVEEKIAVEYGLDRYYLIEGCVYRLKGIKKKIYERK